MTFYTGQKVTLIRSVNWRPLDPMQASPLPRLPQHGEVYTVWRVDFDPARLDGDVIDEWLLLHELNDHRFEAALFRPVCERRFDISVFTRQPSRIDA